MKNFHRILSILIGLYANSAAGKPLFGEFSHDRLLNAVKEIDQLYVTKNKKIAAQVFGIGSLAAVLGVCFYKQNGSSEQQNTDLEISLNTIFKTIEKQNSVSSKTRGVIFSSLGTGIVWCVKDIWNQYFNKPEYAYFKKNFYNFDLHLIRIRDAAEECEKQKDPRNLEYFRAELVASFNDMVHSLEKIIGVMHVLSQQEDIKSERIVFYKKYLIKQVGLLGSDLDRLLLSKQQEDSFISVSKDGITKINMTLNQLVTLYPTLNELQQEITTAQRIKRTEFKVDALVNFLVKSEERKE